MKQFLFFVIILISCSTIMSQTWIGLSKNEPEEPEIILTGSSNQKVSFTMNLSGFFSTTIIEEGVSYHRLAIPGCGRTSEIGAPEVPVISQRIAIPQSSGVIYSVRVTASQTLSDYMVYPVPKWLSDSSGRLTEQFTNMYFM